MGNDEHYDIPNFDCIVQYKRNDVRASGVAIYKNFNDTTNIITPNMEITMSNTNVINVRWTIIGDICACVCKMDNNVEIVMVVIYISPNSKLEDIEFFIHHVLLEYTKEGSLLGTWQKSPSASTNFGWRF